MWRSWSSAKVVVREQSSILSAVRRVTGEVSGNVAIGYFGLLRMARCSRPRQTILKPHLPLAPVDFDD